MILLLAAASFLSTPLAGANASPQLGEATRANLAAMIVSPPPRSPAVEGADGVLAVDAIRRMHTDKVKPLKNTATPPVTIWERSPK
jgi:hypothetical protein